jgi:hypothetical protein
MFYLSLTLNTLCSFRDETNFFGGGCTMQHMQHTNWEVIILLADMDSRKVGFARYLLVSSLAQSLLLSFHHKLQSLCRSQSSFEVAEKSDREQTLAV